MRLINHAARGLTPDGKIKRFPVQYKAGRCPDSQKICPEPKKKGRPIGIKQSAPTIPTEERKARKKITRRAYHLKTLYGLTVEEFEAMLLLQNGECAICSTSEPGPKGWHVDHCHKSNDIRGILCSPCNRGIGMLKDCPLIVKAALEYLIQANEQ